MAEDETRKTPAPALPTILGPGAIPEAQAEYEPTLNGATRDEIIEILNPMTYDFVAKVGVTKTAMMPVRINNPNNTSIKTEGDLAAKGVGGFRNPDLGGGKVHIANPVPIPAGTTIKQPGDVAQVIVKQLITAVISIRGDRLKISDPETRRNVEREIIISRRPMSELFGAGGPITVEEQMRAAVEQANKTSSEEQGFPDVKPPELTVEKPKAKGRPVGWKPGQPYA